MREKHHHESGFSIRQNQRGGVVRTKRDLGAMGVLAFGDSSTWAIKDYEDPTHVKKLAKASHKPFEEREKEKKAGLVSLKKVLQAPSSKDKSRKKSRGVRDNLNPLPPLPSSDSNNPNFAPRSAWPEGKFTIKYPKGYDPELRRFVKDHTGSAVVVTKLPAAVRQRLEDEAKAREEAEANARKEAAAVLNLDEEYLEKVRCRRRRPRADEENLVKRHQHQ